MSTQSTGFKKILFLKTFAEIKRERYGRLSHIVNNGNFRRHTVRRLENLVVTNHLFSQKWLKVRKFKKSTDLNVCLPKGRGTNHISPLKLKRTDFKLFVPSTLNIWNNPRITRIVRLRCFFFSGISSILNVKVCPYLNEVMNRL